MMCSTESVLTLLLSCCCSVAKWCPTVCYPMDCSLPGFSIQGVFQTRILEQVTIFFKVSSWPRDWTWISCSGRQILYHWGIWRGPLTGYCRSILLEMHVFYFRKIILLAFFNSFPVTFFFPISHKSPVCWMLNLLNGLVFTLSSLIFVSLSLSEDFISLSFFQTFYRNLFSNGILCYK